MATTKDGTVMTPTDSTPMMASAGVRYALPTGSQRHADKGQPWRQRRDAQHQRVGSASMTSIETGRVDDTS